MLFLGLIGLAVLTGIMASLIAVGFGGKFSYQAMVLIGIFAIFFNIFIGQSVYSTDNQNDAAATFFIIAAFDVVGLLGICAVCWAVKKDSR